MKLRKLRRKLYVAIFRHDVKREQKIWYKILKKSIRHKHTQDIH